MGWSYRYQYDRLHLIANNSCFLILPGHHYPNLASRVLALCERRIAQDWQERFG
ncbi:Druantia anti-phage system protein DruA, partial [Thiolapillus sp.]|uniref:Druantia anti-phage system protein DruA n=1 Tax=Thiolapillus sp. TaxID=2017437 RepID=UPI003AF56D46